MELVCGYASSDDEEGDALHKPIDKESLTDHEFAITAPIKQEGAKLIEKEPEAKATKKKGLIFSALPIEIQNALTRGISSQDSDSDEDAQAKPLYISSKTLKNSELISILPPPKAGIADILSGVGKQTSLPLPSGGSRLSDNGKLSQQDNTELSSDDENLNIKEVESDNEHDLPDQPTSHAYFSFPEDRTSVAKEEAPLKPQLMSSSITLAPIIPAAATPSEPLRPKFAPVSQLLGVNAAPEVGAYAAATGTSIYPSVTSSNPYGTRNAGVYATSTSTSYASYSSADSNSGNSYAESISTTSTTSTGNKRRRERDLEQELLSGNLEAVESIGAVKEMNVTNDWNSALYTAAQKSQADIQSQFKISGSASSMEPSRTQSRKHQITSLAAQAAKMEMALLEAKGTRMKTKAETKSKYGW